MKRRSWSATSRSGSGVQLPSPSISDRVSRSKSGSNCSRGRSLLMRKSVKIKARATARSPVWRRDRREEKKQRAANRAEGGAGRTVSRRRISCRRARTVSQSIPFRRREISQRAISSAAAAAKIQLGRKESWLSRICVARRMTAEVYRTPPKSKSLSTSFFGGRRAS